VKENAINESSVEEEGEEEEENWGKQVSKYAREFEKNISRSNIILTPQMTPHPTGAIAVGRAVICSTTFATLLHSDIYLTRTPYNILPYSCCTT
jgi:hypothetical protein